jgi:thioredoxin 1
MSQERSVSMARAVTDDSFEAEVLRSPRPVIVEYWAQWCPPCRLVAPVLEEIAADYAGRVTLVTVNIDENPHSTGGYGILAVPTVSVFADGEVVKQLTGARSKAAFVRELGEFLGAPAA